MGAVGFWIKDYRQVVSGDDGEELAQQLRQTGNLWRDLGSSPTSFIVKEEPEPQLVRRGQSLKIETPCTLDQYRERYLPTDSSQAVPQLRILHSGLIEGRAIPTDEILQQVSHRALPPRVVLEITKVLRKRLEEIDESLAVHLNKISYNEDKNKAECRYGAGVEISRCHQEVKAHGLSLE